MVKYINGICLKQGEIQECPTFGLSDKPDIIPIQLEKQFKMEAKKPIKRNKNLQPLSRDHHHSLLLSWKIRTGFSKGVATERIKCYADWFFAHHIHPHFEMEEKHLFPIMESNNPLVKKAIAQHKRLRRLFNDTKNIEKSLTLIEEELEQHIRFEERVLFNEIQKIATEKQLLIISKIHTDGKFNDNTDDPFWL